MDAVGGDIELNSSSKIKLDAVQFVELSGNQVCIDAGGGGGSGGVNIGSDAKITMDANRYCNLISSVHWILKDAVLI